MPDPLATATERIRELMTRKVKPLSTLEAVFAVSEQMSEEDAKEVLRRLIQQRFLCQVDGDLAQMLAARLGVEVRWSHMKFSDGEMKEGRGS